MNQANIIKFAMYIAENGARTLSWQEGVIAMKLNIWILEEFDKGHDVDELECQMKCGELIAEVQGNEN